MRKSPDLIDKHVGTRVRMRRLMLGMTQTELANALGITFQQVQKYEKGDNRISAGKPAAISSFLQAPIPFFFEGLPTGEKPVKKDDPLPSDVFQFLATSDGVSLVNHSRKSKAQSFGTALSASSRN